MRKSSRNGATARIPARCQQLERRRLLAAVSWDGGGDGSNWTDPQNWSNNVVPAAGDDVTINVPTNPTVVLTGSLAVHSLVNAETLIIRGSSAQSNGILNLGDGGGTNNGTIELDVASTGGYASFLFLAANSTFTNAGTIATTPNAASNDVRRIQGSSSTTSVLVNSGTIDVAGGSLDMTNLAFTQQGTITIAAGKALTCSSTSFHYVNGSNQSGLILLSSTVALDAASSASTVVVQGAGNTFLGNSSANLTLDLQANNVQSNATLQINADVTNAGTILMDVASAGGFASLITLAAGITFTNAAGGVIRTTAQMSPGEVRRISGVGAASSTFLNTGTLDVAGGSLDAQQLAFTQQGTISIAAGNRLTLSSTALHYVTGSNQPGLLVVSSTIDLDAASAASTVLAEGPGNTLIGHDAANITLDLQANSTQGGATLQITSNVTSNGPIWLDVASIGGYASIITIATGATFTNGAGGTIHTTALMTAGEVRRISGAGPANGTFVNLGTLDVAGASMDVSSVAFDQRGTINIAATRNLIVTSTAFTYNAGSNQDGLVVRSSAILLNAASSASTILADGAGDTLLGVGAGNLTLVLQANSNQGSANLVVNGNVSNSGTILLDVASAGGYASIIAVTSGATFTNAAGGIIRTTALITPGEVRRIAGAGVAGSTFVNSGALSVAGANLEVSTITFDQRGTINIASTPRLIVNSSVLSYNGGFNQPGLIVRSCTLDLNTASAASTIVADGAGDILLGNHSANLTVDLQANSTQGSALLSVSGNAINAGTILLDVQSPGGYAATLVVPSGTTFTNTSTGIIHVLSPGANGVPSISVATSPTPATFTNAGRIVFDVDAHLGGNGPITNTGVIRKPDAGESTFAPTLVNTGTGLVDVLAGTLRFTGATNIGAGGFLSTGSYHVASGSTLAFGFDASAHPTVLTAEVEISGTGVAELDRLSINRGRIALLAGANLSVAPAGGTHTLEGILDLSPTSTFAVTGGMTFAGTSQPIIRVEIGSASQFGKVTVSGALNLNSPDSTSRFDPDLVGGYDPAVGSHHNVIVAGGGISNAFDAFFGGATPSNNSLVLERPSSTTVSVGVIAGPPPPPPQILSETYDDQTRQAVVFTFDQNVSAFLSRKDYQLQNLTTAQTIAQSAGSLSYNTTSNQATLLLTNQLPDGNYRLTVNASDVANSAGVPASGSPVVLDFFVLPGDANHDRHVDLTDFTILAANFNTTGRNFAQGNFDYDAAGTVDLTDFTMLAARFNKSLPPPAAPALLAAPAPMAVVLAAPPATPFSVAPIDGDQPGDDVRAILDPVDQSV